MWEVSEIKPEAENVEASFIDVVTAGGLPPPPPGAAAFVCALKDIQESRRYVIELFSSSLYSSNHDATQSLAFIYRLNVPGNALKTLVFVWLYDLKMRYLHPCD